MVGRWTPPVWLFSGLLLVPAGFTATKMLREAHLDFNAKSEQILELPPNDINGALALVDEMSDPVERGLAVQRWVNQNRGKTDISHAEVLCEQLAGDQVRTCKRHLSAAHLRR